jgi:hypothetical protein
MRHQKTEGEKLFDSYDRTVTGIAVEGRFLRISEAFPRKSWNQLHTSERERWEQIARGEFRGRWE